ncbi:hypothetical protein JB92DRAFT_2830471 [Gautieria morchelliformis]|nr:hypothetical protein JB92DRAFT_2830471 [Gautieria morchelliformis]
MKIPRQSPRDSQRPLEWSDLGIRNIPNVSAGFDAEIADDEPTAWYELKVFYASEITKPMLYDNTHFFRDHLERVKALHKASNIDLSKVTHAMHVYAAEISHAHGTSMDDTKALALLGATMFNAAKPENHALPRDCLEPPKEIVGGIFPWVEEEMEALHNRRDAHEECRDFALDRFLALLGFMRKILVQDLAVLFQNAPDSHIFSYEPFN